MDPVLINLSVIQSKVLYLYTAFEQQVPIAVNKSSQSGEKFPKQRCHVPNPIPCISSFSAPFCALDFCHSNINGGSLEITPL